MIWDTWFCPNQSCATQLWLAQRCSEQQDDWLIGPSVTAPAWRFAGPRPICPLCGTTLITPIDWVTGRVDTADQTGTQPWPYACDHYSCAPTQKDEAQHEDTNH